MPPYSFPQGIYTHVYFAFGSIDPATFQVIPASIGDERLYTQLRALRALRALRTRNLGQQFCISIGGWDFTDSGKPTATTFSDLAGPYISYQNVFSPLILFMTK